MSINIDSFMSQDLGLHCTLVFGSCKNVDDDTDNEDDGPNYGENHPEHVFLVFKEVLLHVPLIL